MDAGRDADNPRSDKKIENGSSSGGSSATRSLFRPSALSAFTQRLSTYSGSGNLAKSDSDTKPKVFSWNNSSTDGSSKEVSKSILPPFSFGKIAVEKKDESSAGDRKDGKFVFGQNLENRVVNVDIPSGQQNGKTLADLAQESTSSTSLNDTAPAAASVSSSDTQVLKEAAEAYRARHDHVTELRAVERALTGEEGETNVLQMGCRLHLFQPDAPGDTPWVERGRGTLRLNDITHHISPDGHFESRLVIRQAGNFRLLLNARLFPEMSVSRPSARSVRFTALDCSSSSVAVEATAASGGSAAASIAAVPAAAAAVRVYLVRLAPQDSEHLFSAIESRLAELRKSATHQRSAATHHKLHSSPPEPLLAELSSSSSPRGDASGSAAGVSSGITGRASLGEDGAAAPPSADASGGTTTATTTNTSTSSLSGRSSDDSCNSRKTPSPVVRRSCRRRPADSDADEADDDDSSASAPPTKQARISPASVVSADPNAAAAGSSSGSSPTTTVPSSEHD